MHSFSDANCMTYLTRIIIAIVRCINQNGNLQNITQKTKDLAIRLTLIP
jgi:hypothetical protein